MTTTRRPRLTEPLETITAFFATFLLLTLAAGTVLTLTGSGSLGGFGDTQICVTQPNTGYGGDNWTSHLGITHRPGTTVQINGTLQACALHPGIGQRMLYTLLSLPSSLVWMAVLLLLWRVIRAARQAGPFTVQAAVAMRRLGWLIIAGTAVAAAVQGFALDKLLNTMLTPPTAYGDAVLGAFHALLPVPVLAGAALLTFARIIRLGAAMDDEIKATV
ncbi:MAG TPA: DUF2975 domain-containing protein [Streptosporangiaceae bacterium]|jgi:hypothetical protein